MHSQMINEKLTKTNMTDTRILETPLIYYQTHHTTTVQSLQQTMDKCPKHLFPSKSNIIQAI